MIYEIYKIHRSSIWLQEQNTVFAHFPRALANSQALRHRAQTFNKENFPQIRIQVFSSPWAMYCRLTANMKAIMTHSEPNPSYFPQGKVWQTGLMSMHLIRDSTADRWLTTSKCDENGKQNSGNLILIASLMNIFIVISQCVVQDRSTKCRDHVHFTKRLDSALQLQLHLS